MRRAPVGRPAGPAIVLATLFLLGACRHVAPPPPEAAASGDGASKDAAAAAPAAAADLPPPRLDGGQDGTAPPHRGGLAVPGLATAAIAAPAWSVPHVYMALQPGGEGMPISVVFAIDEDRDGNPSNDPAIRLTPEDGRCNPQELRYYAFPPESGKPVVSEVEQEKGLGPLDLPRYLAARVTEEMLSRGLASEPEETRPQNVCTRKLWEALVVAENTGAGGSSAAE